uniref:Putative ATPase domain containing protein n=1 Tax=viral metagenome TaxID=1070528 RepID=A0A6M3JPG7_9ZZZZ
MSDLLADFGIEPASNFDKLAYIIAGPPGTGKSWLLGTMAEQSERTLVIATLPREAKSTKYLENADRVDVALLTDPDWAPSQNRFEASAFLTALELFEALYEDEKYDTIILDNGTEFVEHTWHECLKFHGVASPAEMDGESRWTPYEALKGKLDEGVKLLVGLSTTEAARPKNVGIAWHTQAPKEDTVEGSGNFRKVKKSADSVSKHVEYEGNVLPNVRGGYRRLLASQVDAYLLTQLDQVMIRGADKKTKKVMKYRVQVMTNPERHVKLPGKMPDEEFIENNWAELQRLLALPGAKVQKATVKKKKVRKV